MADWTEASAPICAAGEASGGLDKAGSIAIIVASIIATIVLVWIVRESGKRD